MKIKILFIVFFNLLLFLTNAKAQDISKVEVLQFTKGKYQIRIEMADSLQNEILSDPNRYNLKEMKTSNEVQLPAPRLWRSRPGTGVRFIGVDITHTKEYIIQFETQFETFEASFDSSNFKLRKSSKFWDDFEKGRSEPWQRSIKPKIAQGDSTLNEIGDIGFDLLFKKKLPNRFDFLFDASLTLNKDDPNNHWKLNFAWRSPVWLISSRFGLRPILSLQDNATQALKFHDISGSAFLSVFLHPFNGIQPIFVTGGLDYSRRLHIDGDDFDDPRFSLQAQWGMIGLLGKGSGFFIDFRYWRRIDSLGDPTIDPNQEKERHFVQLEFVLPIVAGKNLTIKYADGEVAPTFAKDTSVHLGLEFFFGGQRIALPGKE